MDVNLINAGLRNRYGVRCLEIPGHHATRAHGLLGRIGWIQHQAVAVFCRRHGDAKAPKVRQFAQGNLEVRSRPVGAIAFKQFVAGNGRPQQQSARNRAIGLPFRIAAFAPQVGKHRVIDTVVLSPAAHRVVARVAFDETILGPHGARLESERLAEYRLRYQNVLVVQ